MTQEPTASSAEDTKPESVTINIKSTSTKHTLSIPLSMTVIELKNKLSSPDYVDVPAGSQRLIYSGRVLKDPDTLESHKIKDGHTIHLVKSAPSNQRQNPVIQSPSEGSARDSTASSNAPRATGVPSNIAAGTGNNPLAGLTGARYAGFAQLPGAGMFGPDGGVSRVQFHYRVSSLICLCRWGRHRAKIR
jgi:ubiquilin